MQVKNNLIKAIVKEIEAFKAKKALEQSLPQNLAMVYLTLHDEIVSVC